LNTGSQRLLSGFRGKGRTPIIRERVVTKGRLKPRKSLAKGGWDSPSNGSDMEPDGVAMDEDDEDKDEEDEDEEDEDEDMSEGEEDKDMDADMDVDVDVGIDEDKDESSVEKYHQGECFVLKSRHTIDLCQVLKIS
jgi:hypothetical protein